MDYQIEEYVPQIRGLSMDPMLREIERPTVYESGGKLSYANDAVVLREWIGSVFKWSMENRSSLLSELLCY